MKNYSQITLKQYSWANMKDHHSITLGNDVKKPADEQQALTDHLKELAFILTNSKTLPGLMQLCRRHLLKAFKGKVSAAATEKQ